MKIKLETTDCSFVVETTTQDYTCAIDATGVTWLVAEKPTNLPGERWDSEDGETAWRK